MVQPLFELFYRCTVLIKVLDDPQGTGFFVAPGLILTCAHVVESANDDVNHIKVYHDTKEFCVQRIDLRHKPYPDLALITVNFHDHPCVYLDAEVWPGDQLFVFSHTDEYRGGVSTPVKYDGPARITNQQWLLRFGAGQIIPGYSGSPLLNGRTGGVCGVVKSTQDDMSIISIKMHLPKMSRCCIDFPMEKGEGFAYTA